MIRIVQKMLQKLYGFDVGYDVADFLITDAALARYLGGETAAGIPENLLIRQDGDTLDISLYLDRELVELLERENPFRQLHASNISEFCTALEGVSHFLYLAWNAGSDRSITLLELEMQAEVDKYAVLALLLKTQRKDSLPGWLRSWLFEDVSFRSAPGSAEHERYCHANHFARRFCQHLERRFRWRWNGLDLVAELRAFYRLRQQQKIEFINHACA